MPIYLWNCRCMQVVEDFASIADRDKPKKCPTCKRTMERMMVYAVRTLTNEASVWPQENNALVPDDPKLAKQYRDKGWLVSDGLGGETVRCESEKHFQTMMKQQGLKMSGDYDKISKSGPSRRKKPMKLKDRPDQKRAKENARKELRERGLLK